MADASRSETINKLRKKAELNRHIHGELERVKRQQGRALYAAVQIIGVIVATAAAAYFRLAREELNEASTPGELLLWMVMILPAISTSLVILDATVFRLRDREEEHKKAVKLWGDWIRKTKQAMEKDEAGADGDDSTGKVTREYRKCMEETPTLPLSTNKFLEYKRDWIYKRKESAKLDRERRIDGT